MFVQLMDFMDGNAFNDMQDLFNNIILTPAPFIFYFEKSLN